MVIGVKYCGGCNPRYDRNGIVKKLQEAFPNLTVAGADSLDTLPDLVAVICGCSNQCAAHEHLEGAYGKVLLWEESHYDLLHDAVEQAQITKE